jgi:hypothetical protein
VAQFRYLGTTITNQNLIQEEMLTTIRSRTFLSSRLLSKIIKIRIYKTIILPVVLYGCETLSLTIFGPKRDDVTGGWRKLHIE